MRADFIPGLSVELCSNGRALREFDDENTISGENLTTTRYVEAVPNAQFSAHLSFEPKFRYILDDLAVGICIDGQEMTSHCLPSRPDRHLRHHCIGESITNINGVGHRQVLTFGELKTTDGSPERSGSSRLKDILSKLGEVTVWATRIKIVGRNEPRDHRRPNFEPIIGDSVPEKALKGRSISNRVTLKDAGTCQAQGTINADYPYGREPFAKFTFKYRSHRDLQIEGIIPRSPSPEPAEELDYENMTREEAIEALRQQRAHAAPTTRIKRERAATLAIDLSDDDNENDDDGDEGGVSITSVGPVKKRHRTYNDSGINIIDLTDD